MPTLDWNLHQWNTAHHWAKAGSEWSSALGGGDMQWYGSILPRLHRYLPARHILEIAPGYGRWTTYLARNCHTLTAVDLSTKCIAFCRDRFSSIEHVNLHVNDGQSLSMVEDRSVDLIFSFDSLVHVEKDIIALYLNEIARVLQPQGIAFLHHSNLGCYPHYFSTIKKLKRMISRSGHPVQHDSAECNSDRSRALSMSAEVFAELAKDAGLKCVSQETINWGTKRMIDCISVVSLKDSDWPSWVKIANPHFMRNASLLKALAKPYGTSKEQA